MALDQSIPEVEATMAEIATNWVHYQNVVEEYKRLLKIMGSVEDDGIIQLVLAAAASVDALDAISPFPDTHEPGTA